MPVSRQTESRFGPSHCGQSSARAVPLARSSQVNRPAGILAKRSMAGRYPRTAERANGKMVVIAQNQEETRGGQNNVGQNNRRREKHGEPGWGGKLGSRAGSPAF